MDRRSWLWRRKSPEKVPGGEKESSGSLSSHSERFSDDQIVTQTAAGDEQELTTVKTLTDKLSDALVNIQAKEDLVKQHAKVAEEAVSGWEKAENEVLVLKKQNEALTQTNSFLEVRVGHLDGALKECLRQLRKTKDEQDLRLEALENENSTLRDGLRSKTEELELRTSERDLSTRAAEIASKLRLDCIKKVAKLEAECCQLKAAIQKATVSNCKESYMENSFFESDAILPISAMVPHVGVDLMDDFLEMERLASGDNQKMILEENLKRIKSEKEDLEEKLANMKAWLDLANKEKRDTEKELECTRVEMTDLKNRLCENQDRLAEVNEVRKKLEEELTDVRRKNEEAELRINMMDQELGTLRLGICTLEKELEKEKIVSREAEAKGVRLEAEMSIMVPDLEIWRSEGVDEYRFHQDQELAIAASKFAECQKTIASLGRQLESLTAFDDFLVDSDRSVVVL